MRARAVALGTVLPLLLLAAAAILIGSWRGRLPVPVVTHWGASGPDAFGSFTSLVTPLVVMAMALCGPLAIICCLPLRGTRRMFVELSAGVATMIAGISQSMVSM